MDKTHRSVVLVLRLLLALLAVASLILVTITPAGAILPGSTFEGNDGNLVVDHAGDTDWANAPNRVIGVDQSSGSADNAFGQGTKEDNPAVTVVNGSIQLNQNATTGFTNTTTGPVTLNRTPGDILITYDFGGSGTPSLGLLKWITSANGTVANCFSANALPCWGKRVDLSAAGFAEGAVNAATVTDPIANTSLTTGLFGEAAVNLTSAGVFPPGTCEAFGSTFLKSRSSTSFTAEIKDFIAPQPVSISNCGTVKIHKVTENGNGTFGYTATGGLSPTTFTLSNGGLRTYSGVPIGSYTVTESTLPAGWTLKSLVCTANGTGTTATPSGATVSIGMAGGGVVDCTYTNHTNLSPTIATTLSAGSVSIGTA